MIFSSFRSAVVWGVFFLVCVCLLGEEGEYNNVRTAVHHPVRVNERESTGELLCERTNLALPEASSAVNEKVQETHGLEYIASLCGPAFCSGPRAHVGWR